MIDTLCRFRGMYSTHDMTDVFAFLVHMRINHIIDYSYCYENVDLLLSPHITPFVLRVW